MGGNALGGGGGWSGRACFMRGQVGRGAWNGIKSDCSDQKHGFKRTGTEEHDGCDHTSTNAPDPIRTPQLSVLGRE